jgi:hypothetical protein
MQLSDAVSGAGLSHYAQVALVVALAGFLALLVYLFGFRRRKRHWKQMAQLPLDGSGPAAPEDDNEATSNERETS